MPRYPARKVKSVAAFGAALLVILSEPAHAQTQSLPLIEFQAGQGFVPGELAEVEFPETASGLEIGVYPRAQSECSLQAEEAVRTIEVALSPGGRVRTALKSLGLEPGEVQSAILVTSLGPARGTFSSFFIHHMPGLEKPAIVLDCDAHSRRYWVATLAHEMTHALLLPQRVPAWLDEMAAQLIEHGAGGANPEAQLKEFRAKLLAGEAIPPLWDENTQLRSARQYAIDYLFGKYWLAHRGGWPALQALLRQATSRVDWGELVTSFYKAMLVSKVGDRKYSIPGWEALPASIARACSQAAMLQPGQAVICAQDQHRAFGAGLAVYDIGYSTEHFRIAARPANSSMAAAASDMAWPNEVTLVVNPGREPVGLGSP